MQEFYTPNQRQLQDRFETRDLADRLQLAIVTEELSPEQMDFIHARNMFFLSTIDEFGFPSASYKGGAPGFVRAPRGGELYFPNYDGNGMYMSLGNIEASGKVGLLESFPGAQLVVKVAIEKVWQNCPRYVHRMQLTEASPYLPAEDGTAQLALWKRIDGVQDVLTEQDRSEAELQGLISVEEYDSLVNRGEVVQGRS